MKIIASWVKGIECDTMVFELYIALEIEFKFQTLLKLGVGGKGNILQINAAKFTPTQNSFHVVSSV